MRLHATTAAGSSSFVKTTRRRDLARAFRHSAERARDRADFQQRVNGLIARAASQGDVVSLRGWRTWKDGAWRSAERAWNEVRAQVDVGAAS